MIKYTKSRHIAFIALSSALAIVVTVGLGLMIPVVENAETGSPTSLPVPMECKEFYGNRDIWTSLNDSITLDIDGRKYLRLDSYACFLALDKEFQPIWNKAGDQLQAHATLKYHAHDSYLTYLVLVFTTLFYGALWFLPRPNGERKQQMRMALVYIIVIALVWESFVIVNSVPLTTPEKSADLIAARQVFGDEFKISEGFMDAPIRLETPVSIMMTSSPNAIDAIQLLNSALNRTGFDRTTLLICFVGLLAAMFGVWFVCETEDMRRTASHVSDSASEGEMPMLSESHYVQAEHEKESVTYGIHPTAPSPA